MGYSWKRAKTSLKKLRDESEFDTKQKQLIKLAELHKQSYIDLYFADESHFGLTPEITYAWQHKNEPILLPASKSKRLTVLGLMTPDCKLQAFTTEGGMNSEPMIEASINLSRQRTRIQLSLWIMPSNLFKSKIKRWEENDLYIFFLPPYSPELNKIEILWRFIKYKWLPFDAFSNLQNLKERLNDVLLKIGTEYVINFY